MKLGYIDYLNCYPFYYHMFEQRPLEGVEIVPGYPSRLNALMINGDLDMSPISAAILPKIQDSVCVLPDFCLSSAGYVGSVRLLSKMPIESLHEKVVGITTASDTSVVALKILLQKFFQIMPRYIRTPPTPNVSEVDAALVIGNEAMVHLDTPIHYSYDIGDLWLRKTGLPVVFAIFVIRKEAIARFGPEINQALRSYRTSLNSISADREQLIYKASIRYPEIKVDIDDYFRLLKFNFSPELKKALEYYYSIASEMGFLPGVRRIDYYSPEIQNNRN